MNITVAQGPVDLGFSGTQQPILQNLGPGTIYIYTSSTGVVTNGIQLPLGAVYEFPKTLIEGPGSVWVQADGGTCDLRVINVG